MCRRYLSRLDCLPGPDGAYQGQVLAAHLAPAFRRLERGLGGGENPVPERVDRRAAQWAVRHLVDQLVECPVRYNCGIHLAFVGRALGRLGRLLQAVELSRRDFSGCDPLGRQFRMKPLETGSHQKRAAKLAIVHPRRAQAATVRQRKPSDFEAAKHFSHGGPRHPSRVAKGSSARRDPGRKSLSTMRERISAYAESTTESGDHLDPPLVAFEPSSTTTPTGHPSYTWIRGLWVTGKFTDDAMKHFSAAS